MDDRMSPAEVAATRHLLGLSQSELCDLLGIARSTLHDWERGKWRPSAGLQADLLALRAEHDAEAERLADGAADGMIISLTPGPRHLGWSVALGARVMDRVPGAMIEWTVTSALGDG